MFTLLSSLPLSSPALAAISVLGVLILFLLKRLRRYSISYLPAPECPSWLVGNIPEFQRPREAGDADFQWSKKFGLAFRTKGCFGEDILYLADPKKFGIPQAIQYVLNKSGYNFAKTLELRIRQQYSTGYDSIVWAEGEQHAKHRKIMNPAFSYNALKGFVPVFTEHAKKVANAWKDILDKENGNSSILNVPPWLSRTTLDIIGATAFGYNVGALGGSDSEIYKAYYNLYSQTHYNLSNFTILFRRITSFLPPFLVKYLIYLPKKDLKRMGSFTKVIKTLGEKILAEQVALHATSKPEGKDVISILVKANFSEDPKKRMGDHEVVAQFMALLFVIRITAGHETTATTLSWIFYELSKRPDIQACLRNEISETRKKVINRGDTEFSIADMESMPYTAAVMKETLRYRPIVLHLFRRAIRDDVIPLDVPQRTASGNLINEIPISKGQAVTLSVCVYNRLKSIWGEDADEWKPERFLDESFIAKHSYHVGVISDLTLEMQVILMELVENFAFAPASSEPDIKAAVASSVVQPMVRGEEHEGSKVPLSVTLVQ
ncbi:hypothetical protein Clacol_003591 [Clathrus columnatus]|uniref:Cytochrome P450 n=1 Tax=Clathrus columnatus TaxID=1419009 RepID=A0AAV5A9F4_9AGAM|nr:hypothetical protein Clacol_003591 [Clathrus columnatus]